jgi:hypothetical protein
MLRLLLEVGLTNLLGGDEVWTIRHRMNINKHSYAYPQF